MKDGHGLQSRTESRPWGFADATRMACFKDRSDTLVGALFIPVRFAWEWVGREVRPRQGALMKQKTALASLAMAQAASSVNTLTGFATLWIDDCFLWPYRLATISIRLVKRVVAFRAV